MSSRGLGTVSAGGSRSKCGIDATSRVGVRRGVTRRFLSVPRNTRIDPVTFLVLDCVLG
jgi:hypothetical protein